VNTYRLEQLLRELGGHELLTLLETWGGVDGVPVDTDGAAHGPAVETLLSRMQNPETVREQLATLGRGERIVLDRLMQHADLCLPYRRIVSELPGTDGMSQSDVENQVKSLERRGFLFRVGGTNWTRFEDGAADGSAVAVPGEFGELLRDQPRLPVLTLKEFLEKRHFATDNQKEGRAAQHARQAYKLFVTQSSVLARIRRLPEDVRRLVELAMTRYGGLLPRSLLVRTVGDEDERPRDELRQVLEEALLGTLADVDLRAFGIDVDEETLIVFQEVTLIYLRSKAGGEQAVPAVERVAGVDLATNLMRFLRYVDENCVRYTVRGEIFKATRARIVASLVVGPDQDRENCFGFLYGFCVDRRLIERTGERTLRLSEAGHAFESKELPEKLKDLLGFAVQDPSCSGDPFHQVKVRRILLRLLRRLEPDVWYDAMYVPFLARNSYLAQLHTHGVVDFYANRRKHGRSALIENLERLSWHLFHWVRRRLHVLGIVDLGFQGEQPVALRLSQLGASLLAGVPAQAVEGGRSTLVVNPDFEILLFPESDAFSLVHTLDRFARRTGSDRLYRFELDEASVRSALSDGMGVGDILDVLTERCRTPLPQNVLFSLRDWADRAGVLAIDETGCLVVRKPEILDRLLGHARVRELTGERVSPTQLELLSEVKIDDFRALVRDLGFHLEPGAENNAS